MVHCEVRLWCATVTEPVGKHLQAGTEDTPVLNCPAPLRHFHDSGARYKHPDLLTYLQCILPSCSVLSALHCINCY